MTSYYDWNATSKMVHGWQYRVEKKQSDEENEPLNWTDGERIVEVQSPNGAITEYTITAEPGSGPAIDISINGQTHEQLNEETQRAIVSAVSLSTMPVVNWQ